MSPEAKMKLKRSKPDKTREHFPDLLSLKCKYLLCFTLPLVQLSSETLQREKNRAVFNKEHRNNWHQSRILILTSNLANNRFVPDWRQINKRCLHGQLGEQEDHSDEDI